MKDGTPIALSSGGTNRFAGFIDMYSETIDALAQQAAAKLDAQRRSLFAHLIRSMLAGMYVGAAIILIFTIGGSLSKDYPSMVKLLIGVCFGGGATIVIFAGADLV